MSKLSLKSGKVNYLKYDDIFEETYCILDQASKARIVLFVDLRESLQYPKILAPPEK